MVKMKSPKTRLIFVVLATVIVLFPGSKMAIAEVEWEVKQTLDLNKTPVDVAVSPDWQKFFILTEEGDVQIYSGDGRLIDTISVGPHVDDITAGPQGNVLILKSSQNKKIQIASIDFIQDINVSGSPYKGVDDAPVIIAIFSDFE